MNPAPVFLLARSFLVGRTGMHVRSQRYLLGAVFGVALSLVPLVVVQTVSDGMIRGITDRYIETSTYHLQVWMPDGRDTPDLDAYSEAIRGLDGVVSVLPETRGPAVAVSGTRTAGVLLRVVDDRFFSDPGVAGYLELRTGEADVSRGRDIVLGEALARELGLATGDSLTMMTANASAPAPGVPSLTPRLGVFRVRGIVSAGYRELDSTWAFVNRQAGERLLEPGISRFILGIKTQDPYGPLPASVLSGIRGILFRNERIGMHPVARTWTEIETSLFKSFSTTRSLLVLIMALTVAVATVNVGAALGMLVVERRQDIAVLKSTGATPAFITRVFLGAGIFAGGTGTAVGMAAGCLVSWRINEVIALIEHAATAVARIDGYLSGRSDAVPDVRLLDPAYYLAAIPVTIDPLALSVTALAGLLLSVVFSIVPAARAARLSPLEIVRRI